MLRTADLENQENKLPMFSNQSGEALNAYVLECVSNEQGSCIS